MSNKIYHIKKRVQKILADLKIGKAPINPRKIAREYGVKVTEQDFAGELGISAILLKEGGEQVIVVNENHRATRQNFSIAHELGHLFLHAPEAYLTVEKRLMFTRADSITNATEKEANQFAAELLMPEEFIKADFEKLYDSNHDDEDIISEFARAYEVSHDAVVYRLINLKLIK